MRSKGYNWKYTMFQPNNPMCMDWYYYAILWNNRWSHDEGVKRWNNNPICNERRLLILNNNPWGEVLQHNP